MDVLINSACFHLAEAERLAPLKEEFAEACRLLALGTDRPEDIAAAYLAARSGRRKCVKDSLQEKAAKKAMHLMRDLMVLQVGVQHHEFEQELCMLFGSPLENEIRSQMLLAFRGVTEAGQSRETFDAYLAKIDYKAENKEDADEMYRLYSRFVRSLMPWISSDQSRNRTRPPRAPRSKAEKEKEEGSQQD